MSRSSASSSATDLPAKAASTSASTAGWMPLCCAVVSVLVAASEEEEDVPVVVALESDWFALRRFFLSASSATTPTAAHNSAHSPPSASKDAASRRRSSRSGTATTASINCRGPRRSSSRRLRSPRVSLAYAQLATSLLAACSSSSIASMFAAMRSTGRARSPASRSVDRTLVWVWWNSASLRSQSSDCSASFLRASSSRCRSRSASSCSRSWRRFRTFWISSSVSACPRRGGGPPFDDDEAPGPLPDCSSRFFQTNFRPRSESPNGLSSFVYPTSSWSLGFFAFFGRVAASSAGRRVPPSPPSRDGAMLC
mmetsp:Transcript_24829/g.98580  ORF Transcript_24829/g.98580 Transcript_24829/m.98580 type:complete len:311 (-) Transcript_24829:36-968(-)